MGEDSRFTINSLLQTARHIDTHLGLGNSEIIQIVGLANLVERISAQDDVVLTRHYAGVTKGSCNIQAALRGQRSGRSEAMAYPEFHIIKIDFRISGQVIQVPLVSGNIVIAQVFKGILQSQMRTHRNVGRDRNGSDNHIGHGCQ